MIRTKSKPQPSQTPSQSLRRDVLRVVVHNNGTAGESQSTYSGAADCPTAAPSWHRFLANTLVERYRYTSEYRTTVRDVIKEQPAHTRRPAHLRKHAPRPRSRKIYHAHTLGAVLAVLRDSHAITGTCPVPGSRQNCMHRMGRRVGGVGGCAPLFLPNSSLAKGRPAGRLVLLGVLWAMSPTLQLGRGSGHDGER